MRIWETLQGWVWGPGTLVLLMGMGVYLLVALRGLRFWKSWIWRCTFGSMGKGRKNGISPFQAMATALGGTLGVGNISGVAMALVLGGPGAVFWMWCAALGGCAIKYAEVALAVRFRTRRGDEWHGGPMFVLEKAGWPRMAKLYALLGICASFGIGNMTQANTMAAALYQSFQIPPNITGAVLMAVLALVIWGGARRVARVAEVVVPFMGLFYIVMCAVVLYMFAPRIPWAFGQILQGAWQLRAGAGGVVGYAAAQAIRQGMSKGVFSNEAGLGSASVAHAAAEVHNPVAQGAWGIMEVVLDTLVVCTLTALVILVSGVMDTSMTGIALSVVAFDTIRGWGGTLVSVSIVFFSFASMLGWSFYGERFVIYVGKGRGVMAYRCLFLLAAYMGAVANMAAVWGVSEIMNGLMVYPNLLGIWVMRKELIKMTAHYFRK